MSHTTLRGVKNLDTLHALPSQWASNFSEEIHVEAAVDLVAPVTPSSFALAGIAEGITLTWALPTLNDDGTPCYDLADIAVYRSTSASIDITNDGTYDKKTLVGKSEAYTFPATDTTQDYYFVITAIDTSGNESTASSELNDTSNKPIGSDPVIPDDATGLIFKDSIGGDGVVEGYAMIGIAFQTPPATVIGLRSIRLWFQYTDDGGTNWRDEDGVATQWTELFPEGLIGFLHKDVLLQTNIGTRAYRYKATFIGEDDTTESSTADTAGGAATVCAANNDNLVAISIFAMNIVCLGEVTANRITVTNLEAISADLGAITAGSININSAFIVNAAGAVTCTNLAITGGSININSGVFTVNAAGAVACSNLAITGGTINVNSGVFTVSAAGAVACSNLTVTGGGLTGADIRTASSGARIVLSSTGGWGTAHQIEASDASRIRSIYGAGGSQHNSVDGSIGLVLGSINYGYIDIRDEGGVTQVSIVGEDNVSPTNDYIAFFRNDASTSGRPVLKLDQDDTSEGFIDFVGSGKGVINEGVSSVDSVYVEKDGVVRRIALYAV